MDFAKAFDNVNHLLLSSKLKAIDLNPYICNWYLSFLKDRKQRLVFCNTVCSWHSVNKGTTQGSVSGPFLFNLFINDLAITDNSNTSMIKYADDTTIQVNITRSAGCIDVSLDTVNEYLSWSLRNRMSCNVLKCHELILRKRNVQYITEAVDGINQLESLKVLGVTFQNNCRFSEHVKSKLLEANRCLYVIRCIRKEGYTQDEIDLLFKAIVLPKITFGLVIYSASKPELTTIQNFLQRCYKRKYISYYLDIYTLLEKHDNNMYNKIKSDPGHPLFNSLPRIKESSMKLRNNSSLLPRVNTERFKNSFINRLFFKYRLAF